MPQRSSAQRCSSSAPLRNGCGSTVASGGGRATPLATSAQRPRGPLLEQACRLLETLLREHLAAALPASANAT
jgi:hypothetical protein